MTLIKKNKTKKILFLKKILLKYKNKQSIH